jgi:hypothetical protein
VRAQGVRFCGHLLFENDLGYQVRVCGAVMPNYREMHVPGIDILGDQTEEYLTAKQCSSVARQYGKETTISESYGCTGWDFTFEGQKRLWDFQCALGIGLRAQHLSFYSMHGLRKRDFPPAFSYQSESFRYNPVIDGYCSRLGRIMRRGRADPRILVVHPISGLWCEMRQRAGRGPDRGRATWAGHGPNMVALNRQGDELNRFAEALLKNGVDFDFGDEQLMAADGAFRTRGCAIALAAIPSSSCRKPRAFSPPRYALCGNLRRKTAGCSSSSAPLPKLLEGRPAEALHPRRRPGVVRRGGHCAGREPAASRRAH